MKKALEGIRVIDLSHVLAAPTTTMFLADLGAEVIPLDPPPRRRRAGIRSLRRARAEEIRPSFPANRPDLGL